MRGLLAFEQPAWLLTLPRYPHDQCLVAHPSLPVVNPVGSQGQAAQAGSRAGRQPAEQGRPPHSRIPCVAADSDRATAPTGRASRWRKCAGTCAPLHRVGAGQAVRPSRSHQIPKQTQANRQRLSPTPLRSTLCSAAACRQRRRLPPSCSCSRLVRVPPASCARMTTMRSTPRAHR